MSQSKEKVETEIDNEEIVEEEIVEEIVDETAELKKQVEELQDKLLRNSAELENFKRRTNDEKQHFMKYATQEIMGELINIVDNFDRALDSFPSDIDENMYAGVKMIYDQLNRVIASHGVDLIDTVGFKFDPNIHQAVMTGQDDAYESGFVIEEFQKGYRMKDKVLRPAMVKVNE